VQFQPEPGIIRWRLHLRSAPQIVFPFLATAEGRARWLAEEAPERDGAIHFRFINGERIVGRILASDPPHLFRFHYFENSTVTIELAAAADGGTDLLLTESHVSEANKIENTAGWVSVLLALKAAADFAIDLRNHDPDRTWTQGFADN
jgi:uncharacterized protein YndB with AHSA1/START domain